MLAADPPSAEAGLKLTQFFRYAHAEGQRQARLWLPPSVRLESESPWHILLQEGHVQAQWHPAPALLLLSDAADWQLARRLYGPALPSPVLQMFWGSDLRCWGHDAASQPAIRVALGPAVASALESQAVLHEPIHTLPIGWDSDDLPVVATGPRDDSVLILAGEHPALGLALQTRLREQQHSCRLELTPWPLPRWLAAMAQASLVVLIDPELPQPGLGLRRFAAFAFQTPLVSTRAHFADPFCRDGKNALVRPPEVAALASAVHELLDPGAVALRRRLIDAGLASLVRYRRARERLEFEQLLDGYINLWQQARNCHPGWETPFAPR
jgi:hypothetical protein